MSIGILCQPVGTADDGPACWEVVAYAGPSEYECWCVGRSSEPEEPYTREVDA